MTVLEALTLEMEELGLDSADGINICELIDRHNIETLPDHQLLQNAYHLIKKEQR